jgi:hypothetical protein
VNKINPNIAIQKVAYAMALARDRAFKAGEIKDGKTTNEWLDYREAKVKLSQTIADQIQKAYLKGREEVETYLDYFRKVKPIILIKDKKTHKTLDMLDLVPMSDKVCCVHNGVFEYVSTNAKEREKHFLSIQSKGK